LTIKTFQDFYQKYDLKTFDDWQKANTQHPIQPFRADRHKKLAFGILPGYRNFDLFYERYRSGVEIIQATGVLKDGIKILDIGSGEAFFKFFFDAMCPEKIDWHGVEVWKERAEFCRHVGYTIAEETLEKGKLPYESATFDVILASHVLEHLPNPKAIIAEMGRVLKKGGILLIGTPTKPPIIADLDSLYHRLNKRNTGDTQQAFTHNSLEQLILSAMNLPKESVIDKRGFRIVSGRKKLPLENWQWFYELSIFLGEKLLTFVPEVNIILRK